MTYTLSESVRRIDHTLVEIDHQINWLYYLSPLDNDTLWENFLNSGYRNISAFRYPDLSCDLCGLRRTLRELPIDDIEHPLLHALLHEKQLELERFIDLLQLRDTDGFTATSIEIFGVADSGLLRSARKILSVNDGCHPENSSISTGRVGSEEFFGAAERELDKYRQSKPDFHHAVRIIDDLNSQMMVNQGDLLIARSLNIEANRVNALIAHEIGTHVVTSYNGTQQPLRLLEVGLAHYDALQEGLGIFAEYLTGNLPHSRLKVIAARVIAADLVVNGNGFHSIFGMLHDTFHLDAELSFDIAVRACRGGGLTKDAVYLHGLCDLLDYLQAGNDLETLFIGKFSLRQIETIRRLMQERVILGPSLIPHHLRDPDSQRRLRLARRMSVESLYLQDAE